MICHRVFFKHFSMMGHNGLKKTIMSIMTIMSHDSLFEDLFEVLWRDEALDKSSLSHFSKKNFLFGEYRHNLAQNYTANCPINF